MNESSDALAVPIAVAMRRPTLVGIPAMPILPASLVIRRARIEEAGPLAALLGRAYPTETWNVAGTERELFGNATVMATLVVASDERLIATASLQVHLDAPESGWVRWVATEEDRRREGLGRAVVISVLTLAQQAGCREARSYRDRSVGGDRVVSAVRVRATCEERSRTRRLGASDHIATCR
jgi:GNAT superfamily N-acetyltransferase